MRISDWSSDVCSSDLVVRHRLRSRLRGTAHNGIDNGTVLAPRLHDAPRMVELEAPVGRQPVAHVARGLFHIGVVRAGVGEFVEAAVGSVVGLPPAGFGGGAAGDVALCWGSPLPGPPVT